MGHEGPGFRHAACWLVIEPSGFAGELGIRRAMMNGQPVSGRRRWNEAVERLTFLTPRATLKSLACARPATARHAIRAAVDVQGGGSHDWIA